MPELFIRTGHWLQPLTRAALKLLGWRIEGDMPTSPRLIVIVYPHTSTLDGLIGLSVGYGSGLLGGAWPHGFMIKIEWFRTMIGPLVKALGGIGIDRSHSVNAVGQMVTAFEARERLILGITPEGTRRYRNFWRSGFYQIALRAKVPVVPGRLDFGTKTARIGPEMWMTGEVEKDLERLRAFYSGVKGQIPANQAPIRFRDQRLVEAADE